MSEILDRLGAAIEQAWDSGEHPAHNLPPIEFTREESAYLAKAVLQALMEPTEAQWGGLARQLVMWHDMDDRTPRALFKHLERSGYEVPQWLRDEPEMRHLDHVPSKGTRAVLIYRAMLVKALEE